MTPRRAAIRLTPPGPSTVMPRTSDPSSDVRSRTPRVFSLISTFSFARLSSTILNSIGPPGAPLAQG